MADNLAGRAGFGHCHVWRILGERAAVDKIKQILAATMRGNGPFSLNIPDSGSLSGRHHASNIGLTADASADQFLPVSSLTISNNLLDLPSHVANTGDLVNALDLVGKQKWLEPPWLGAMSTHLDALDIAGVPKSSAEKPELSTSLSGMTASFFSEQGSLRADVDQEKGGILNAAKTTEQVSQSRDIAGSESSSALSAGSFLSTGTGTTKLEINALNNRRALQRRHQQGVSFSGLKYYLEKDLLFTCEVGAHGTAASSFAWRADRIKEACSTDGRIFASLVTVLKECLSTQLSTEEAMALKDRNTRKALADQLFKKMQNSTLLHLAAAGEAPCCVHLCKILVEDFDADLDTIRDELGRTARSIAIASKNRKMIEWARAAGSLLGRYKIDEGPLVHKSATCEVRFATDMKETTGCRNVAIKIFSSASQFRKELRVRLRRSPAPGEDVELGSNRFSTEYVVNLLRFHEGRINCLVMPRAERSLYHIIGSERVAGYEPHLIRHYATCIARALQHVHEQGLIHGDVNPRNIVRNGSNLQLVDFDAASEFNDPVCLQKYSPAYMPPEFARVVFFPDDNAEDLDHQLKELQRDFDQVTSPALRAICQSKIDSIIARIEIVRGGKKKAHFAQPTHDIWSFGAVLFYLLTGSTLFQCDSEDCLVRKQDEQELTQWNGIGYHRLERVLAQCPSATANDVQFSKDLLTKCLKPNPRDRPHCMSDILRMPFFDASASADLQTSPEFNRIRVLFAEPLAYFEDGEIKAIERLNFERERALLIECIRKARRHIDVSFEPATDRHLLDAVAARCGVIHISCHGFLVPNRSDTHECMLLFEDGAGGVHFLSTERIQELLEPHSEPVRLVFVSACFSEQIGKAFVDAGVPHVVCCEQSSQLIDGVAAEFMRSFYGMLIEGLTVQTAFSSAVSLVSGRMGREEASKFLLFPMNSTGHDKPIFCAHEIERSEEQKSSHELKLPTQPAIIDGYEVSLFQIVSVLLTEERGKQMVNVVGEKNVHRSNLVAAACHYIRDRLSTSIRINKLLYLKRTPISEEELRNSLLLQLSSQIRAGDYDEQWPSDSMEDAFVFNALAGTKALIVLDEFDGLEDSLADFLVTLFRSAKTVHVLLATQEEVKFSSQDTLHKIAFL
uniref:Protein kinase domain-containing protein n=1 Tax=Odontella aurita TaxID=265563 RepID=A0A7S4JUN9_9STRA|mmetsp:Transcript_54688/g.163434  ORF Transcript_54688/g.163434 Transcript_54688/m.163434 type:complete len:1134 (+) Transcript_54688:949-4350(+)